MTLAHGSKRGETVKNIDFPCSGILVNKDSGAIRLLKNPADYSMGLGVVPDKTLCIVLDRLTVNNELWYLVDLYGTYAYVPKGQLKLRK